MYNLFVISNNSTVAARETVFIFLLRIVIIALRGPTINAIN